MSEINQHGVAGVILAGGLSRRMGGGDKGLLALGGKTMLARVIAAIRPASQPRSRSMPTAIRPGFPPTGCRSSPTPSRGLRDRLRVCSRDCAGPAWRRPAPRTLPASRPCPLPAGRSGRTTCAQPCKTSPTAIASPAPAASCTRSSGSGPSALADDLEHGLWRRAPARCWRWTDTTRNRSRRLRATRDRRRDRRSVLQRQHARRAGRGPPTAGQ